MTQQSTITSFDDTKLFIRQWLIPDAKLTVLIVHGLAEHSGRYEYVAQFFNSNEMNIVSFDLRGHGKSGGNRVDVQQFSDYYQDVKTVVEKIVLPMDTPWVIYGHSLGGFITTGYLEGHTNPMPAAAIISAPALGSAVPAVLKVIAKTLGALLPGIRISADIKGEQLSRDPEVGKRYFEDPLVNLRTTARFGKNFFAEQPRVNDLINTIDTPCFVIHGADDTIMPAGASEPLAANEKIDRRVYPDVRHEPHNETNKEQILQDIADWLHGELEEKL